MAVTPLTPDDVIERIGFAERRMLDLLALNAGDLAGADGSERQQLLQEFFFHLVGAIEVLAQFVNDRRQLGLDPEYASVFDVAKALGADPLALMLRRLHVNARGKPLPKDPYSDEGYLFRVYNYRGQVTHRRRQPLLIAWPSRDVKLVLDPRCSNPVPAGPVRSELQRMLDLVRL